MPWLKTACLLFFLSFGQVFGLGHYPAAGAGALSMGGIGLMQSDVFSAVNNYAMMTGTRKAGIGVSLCNRFGIRDLKQMAICGLIPYKNTAYGCKFFSNGNGVLNDLSMGFGLAHKPHRQFSFGIGANYHLYSIMGYGSSSAISIDCAILAHMTDKWGASFSVSNPLVAKLKGKYVEQLQRTFRLGMLYKVNSKVSLAIEAEKCHSFKTNIKAGCHYQLSPEFYFNMGFASLQSVCSFGIGFKQKQYTLAFASSVGFSPGISSNLSFIYEIGK